MRKVTQAEKVAVAAKYGLHYCKRTGKGLGSWLCPLGSTHGAAYEMDHEIALEDGGSNAPANLWPQPWKEARVKDLIENRVHKEACAGTLNLAYAQQELAQDWTLLLAPAVKVRPAESPLAP